MESLLFSFTVVPQTHLMGCVLLLCTLHQAAKVGSLSPCSYSCHNWHLLENMPLERHLHLPSSISVVQSGCLPDFLTDFIGSLQCLEGNGLAWLPYLEGIPEREFTSGWSILLSLLVADSCLQITPLDPMSLGGETGESVFTVCFTLKSTGKKCW